MGTKKEIVAKRYGKNLVVMIDGGKITRVIDTDKDKKDEVTIKTKIALYNKKNSKELKDQIIDLVDVKKKEKDKKLAEKKGVKKAIKKEAKTTTKNKKEAKEVVKSKSELIKELGGKELTEDDAAELQALLDKIKNKEKQTETSAKVAPQLRTGEY